MKSEICGKACEICGKVCKSDKSYAAHMEQHTNGVIGDDGKVAKPRERGFRKIPRSKRVPLNNPGQKMTVRGIPDDVHECWFEDDGTSLQRALDAGYVFINSDGVEIGDRLEDGNDSMSSLTSMLGGGLNESGQPVRMYLMGIHKDSYEEDQKEAQAAIAAREDQIRSGNFKNNLGASGYVPTGGIQIE